MDATALIGMPCIKMKIRKYGFLIFFAFLVILIFANFSSATTYSSGTYGSGLYGRGTYGSGSVVLPSGGCIYDWLCSEWYPSPCPSEGIQKRVCVNKGTCGGTAGMPDLNRTCTPGVILPREPLFDIFVNIPLQSKWILKGENIEFDVKLTNVGNKSKIDVAFDYIVLNEENKLITEKKETRAIGEKDEFRINLILPDKLELGKYKVFVQITYDVDKTATAEDSFEIVKDDYTILLRQAVSFLPMGIIGIIVLFVLIKLISLMFRKKTKHKYKKERKKRKHEEKKRNKIYRKAARKGAKERKREERRRYLLNLKRRKEYARRVRIEKARARRMKYLKKHRRPKYAKHKIKKIKKRREHKRKSKKREEVRQSLSTEERRKRERAEERQRERMMGNIKKKK